MPVTQFANLRVICLSAASALALAACGDTANTGVRGGPQAVHPSPSALSSAGFASTPTAEGDFAEQLFATFCAGKTPAQSEAALVASSQFRPPQVDILKRLGVRNALYRYAARPLVSVSVVSGPSRFVTCTVAVRSILITQKADGSVRRSG